MRNPVWWLMVKLLPIGTLSKIRAIGKEKILCPYRYGNPIADCIPYDHWENRGKSRERCCSFCGSWHPEDFLKFCDEVIASRGSCGTIELADGRDKIYMNRNWVHNSDDGALKFKMAHLGDIPTECLDKINEAIQISNEMFKIRWAEGKFHIGDPQ